MFFVGLFLPLFWLQNAGAAWSAQVVWVLDGDSLIVKQDDMKTTIRVEGVDAPEKGQPWAGAAKQFAIQRLKGQWVQIRIKEKDHYGRTVAQVFFKDGRSYGKMLVEAGLAWWYRRYSQDPALELAEKKARQAAIGLWSEAKPTPPWVWKRRRRQWRNRHR